MKLSPEEIEIQLNAIRQDYLITLADKRTSIADNYAVLRKDWNQKTYDEFYHLVHSLAGSAETFGLTEVTQHARRLLQLFRQHASKQTLGIDTVREGEDLFECLLSSIDSGLQQLAPTK